MSLDPSPMSSKPTPLLNPTDPAPGRGPAFVGALISVVMAGIVLFVALSYNTQLFFFPEGIKSQANVVAIVAPYHVMGFEYTWYNSLGGPGYLAQNAPQILTSERTDYHMNLVVIDVPANVDANNPTVVNFKPGSSPDAFPDSVYKTVVQQAQAAGLVPVFKLILHVTNSPDPWAGIIGASWYDNSGYYVEYPEEQWIDSYTAYAVHYAQLAQSLHMPFFIMGSDLEHMTTDTPATMSYTTPGPGDKYTCHGRRDCEWQHVLAALRNSTYVPYTVRKRIAGGSYTGKLIYAASSRRDNGQTALNYFEWDPSHFLWWNAVDIIGISALIPLTTNVAPSEAALQQAWMGKNTGTPLAQNYGNIIDQLAELHTQTQLPILFTSAGYESVPGSNQFPGDAPIQSYSNSDLYTGQIEQQTDMQALYDTFIQYSWWIGVVWYGEYPIWPRSSISQVITGNGIANFFALTNQEPALLTDTSWAGDCLLNCQNGEVPAKKAGVWLNSLPYAAIPANP